MSAPLYATLIFLHILAAAFWVGGMATMHFAVRPAAAATLEPPQRLPFMAGALARFLRGVDVALLLLWLSGLGMFHAAGSHWRVHAMFTLALLMTVVYGLLRGRVFPKLRAAVAQSQWPAAASALNTVRQLVSINLALGTLTFAVALIGRAF